MSDRDGVKNRTTILTNAGLASPERASNHPSGKGAGRLPSATGQSRQGALHDHRAKQIEEKKMRTIEEAEEDNEPGDRDPAHP